MRLNRGVHPQLEEAATKLLMDSLKGVTRARDKSDILTPWKEQNRRKREVYVNSGTPEAALRSGNFNRALNTKHPHLNSETTTNRAMRTNVLKIMHSEGHPRTMDHQ